MVADNSIVRSLQLMHYRVVVAAIDQKAEVLVDSGIRRGTDILKAVAPIAKVVLLGRPIL
jgi:isopentenyl diphosphate isomerase/L-lactate dehydrogenase-like FMN-dependent dehydrogenase